MSRDGSQTQEDIHWSVALSVDEELFLLGVMNSKVLWYYIKNISNPYNNSYYGFKTEVSGIVYASAGLSPEDKKRAGATRS